MATRRQQTMAKLTRERTVRERRERKQEKKRLAAEEKKARLAGEIPPGGDEAIEAEASETE